VAEALQGRRPGCVDLLALAPSFIPSSSSPPPHIFPCSRVPAADADSLPRRPPAGFSLTLANNSALAARDAQYAHAELVHSRITLPGTCDALGAGTGDVELDAMELRPPLMDLSGKTRYPVLFQVYVPLSLPLPPARRGNSS